MSGARTPFPLAAGTAAVREATERLQQAQAEGQDYGPGQGANAGAIQVGHQDGQVLIVFDKPVGYAGLPPEAAVELAVQLVRNARAAGLPYAVDLVAGPPSVDLVEAGGEG